MRVRVRSQNRRGASAANRACDSVLDRLSLRRPGRDREQLRPRHQRWYRQRQCVSRHFVERSKGAVVDLLVSANLVELNHLDGFGIVEVTKRRIDDSEMTVLADAEDGEIGRVLLQQLRVASRFCRAVRSVAAQTVELTEWHFVYESIDEKAAK